jgi:hypothetical protein
MNEQLLDFKKFVLFYTGENEDNYEKMIDFISPEVRNNIFAYNTSIAINGKILKTTLDDAPELYRKHLTKIFSNNHNTFLRYHIFPIHNGTEIKIGSIKVGNDNIDLFIQIVFETIEGYDNFFKCLHVVNDIEVTQYYCHVLNFEEGSNNVFKVPFLKEENYIDYINSVYDTNLRESNCEWMITNSEDVKTMKIDF